MNNGSTNRAVTVRTILAGQIAEAVGNRGWSCSIQNDWVQVTCGGQSQKLPIQEFEVDVERAIQTLRVSFASAATRMTYVSPTDKFSAVKGAPWHEYNGRGLHISELSG